MAAQLYRFYGGVHLAAQVFRIAAAQRVGTLTYTYFDEAILRPVYGFLGYRITPHLALQAGFLLRDPGAFTTTSTVINQAGQTMTSQVHEDSYDAAIPVVLRFRLARQPTHRLHLDALLGATAVFHRYQNDAVTTVNGLPISQGHQDKSDRGIYATGGLGIGFDVTPRFELMAEAIVNRRISAIQSDYLHKIMPGIGGGLCCHFNARKSG